MPTDDAIEAAEGKDRYSHDYGEQYSLQSCRPVAHSLLQALHKAGYSSDLNNPYSGETGWHFVLNVVALAKFMPRCQV